MTADSTAIEPSGTMWRSTGPMRGALAASAITGLIVVGAGSRIAMFIIAEVDPGTKGVLTESQAIVGEFTLEGTSQFFVLGTIIGLLFGPIYLGVRRWLPVPRSLRGIAFGYGSLVTGGILLINPDSVDFRIFEPVLLAIALFAALFVTGGVVLASLTDRFHPEPEYPPSVSRIVGGVLVLIALIGTVVITAGIIELVDKEGTCIGATLEFECIPDPDAS